MFRLISPLKITLGNHLPHNFAFAYRGSETLALSMSELHHRAVLWRRNVQIRGSRVGGISSCDRKT